MAYRDIPKSQDKDDIINFLEDIRNRKEFNQYNYGEVTNVSTFMSKFLQLHGPQLFVRNFINYNTPYKRLFINWQTGTGKTIAALSIAKEFATIHKYKKIFITGFTKTLFVNELLSHPEFGFVNDDEIIKLKQLRINSESKSIKSVEYKKLVDYLTQLKRRLTDKGYFKFYGYKELSNSLFIPTLKARTTGFNIKDLFKTSIVKRGNFINVLNEYISDGLIEINKMLLNSMRNSLLIADEIHNLYNIETENNYGIALQYILDTLGKDSPYTVLMSATPMSGSATEIIDLLNILIRKDYLPNNLPLKKEDYFHIIDGQIELKNGALEKLGILSSGRVSFLLDLGKESYPKRLFIGDKINNINYLQFTKCKISDYQRDTIINLEILDESCDNLELICDTKLSVLNSFVFDFAFPDPDSDTIGITSVQDYKNKLKNSSQEWRDNLGIQLIEDRNSKNNDLTISGPILERDTLGKYSAKYLEMLNIINDIIKNDQGKILVYHHRVHTTGVLLIEQVFRMNGYIDEFSNPINSTICSVCSITKGNHSNIDDHEYIPTRFITIHSDIDKNTIMNSIDKFNSVGNVNGYFYRLIIGSKIIRESYNFKAVRHQLVMSIPNDISSLIQVFGRVVRNRSHIELPPEKRDVTIRILISYSDGDELKLENTHNELHRYFKKMKDYLIIQEVDRIIRIYSVDAFLSYNPLKKAFPEIESQNTLDALSYKPINTSNSGVDITKNNVTYYAYGHLNREINVLFDIIWIIFSIEPVWTYESLFDAIIGKYDNIIGKIPRFGYDKESFTKDTYNLALHNLKDRKNTLGTNSNYTIVKIKEYLVMCPIIGDNKPLLVPEIYLRMHTMNKNINTKIKVDIAESVEVLDIYNESIESQFKKLDYPELMLIQYPDYSHCMLIEKIIKESFNNKNNKKYLESIPYKIYSRFNIFITIKQLLDHIKNIMLDHKFIELLKTMSNTLPIGYHYKGMDKIFNGSTFINIPYIFTHYKKIEVSPIIGFSTIEHNELAFKIRPPLKKTDDQRTIVRGKICKHILRTDLNNYMKKIEPLLNKSKLWKSKKYILDGKINTNILCDYLELALITLEEEARKEHKNEVYVYIFNDLI